MPTPSRNPTYEMISFLALKYRKSAVVLSGFALALAIFFGVLGGKFRLIERAGSDLPYWDQWDAEGDSLYRPYLAGSLHALDLTRPHNEHRIAPTLLWALGLFVLNDEQWDGRLQMAANAVVHTCVGLALVALAWRLVGRFAAIIFSIPTLILMISPVSWENTLSGFQSQFYFLILFSGLHLALVFLSRLRSLIWWLAPVAGIWAMMTMGSGVLSSAAVIGVVVLNVVRNRKVTKDDAWIGLIHALIFAWGRWLAVTVVSTGSLKSQNFSQWLDAWLHQLAWPITNGGFAWYSFLGLLPPLLLMGFFLRTKKESPALQLLVGASAWCVAQTMAIAYARGGVGYGFGPRYADLLNVGFLLNFLTLILLGCAARGRFLPFIFGLAAFGLLAAGAKGLRTEEARAERDFVRYLPAYNLARAESVRDWMKLHDPAFFKKIPWQELPFPDANFLSEILDRPEMRRILPPSVRPPPDFSWPASLSTTLQVYRPTETPPSRAPFSLDAWQAMEDGTRTYESNWFINDRGIVSLFVSAPVGAKVSLQLQPERGIALEPLGSPLNFSVGWKRVNFSASPGRYRLTLTIAGLGTVIVTRPQTDTHLSRFAARMVSAGPAFQKVSLIFGLLAIGFTLLSLPRSRAPQRAVSPAPMS